MLESSLRGLDVFMESNPLKLPAGHRLAFRELGLSIGLRAVDRIRDLVREKPDKFTGNQQVFSQIDRLGHFVRLGEIITKFWLEHRNRKSQTWVEHLDINRVMLATSLMPEGYLEL